MISGKDLSHTPPAHFTELICFKMIKNMAENMLQLCKRKLPEIIKCIWRGFLNCNGHCTSETWKTAMQSTQELGCDDRLLGSKYKLDASSLSQPHSTAALIPPPAQVSRHNQKRCFWSINSPGPCTQHSNEPASSIRYHNYLQTWYSCLIKNKNIYSPVFLLGVPDG